MPEPFEPPTLRRVYSALSPNLRHQFWMSVCMWIFVFVAATRNLLAQSQGAPGLNMGEIVTPQNIIVAVVMIYHAGMLREQFTDMRKRLELFEERYVRADLLEERLRPIEDLAKQRLDLLGHNDPRR